VRIHNQETGSGEFGQILRTCRIGAGLTQEELARLARLSERAVRNLELGRTHKPYRRSAQLLADALQLADGVRDEFLTAARGWPPAALSRGDNSSRRGGGRMPHKDERTELDRLRHEVAELRRERDALKRALALRVD
jgi:transcriptional regulator with XRE-family HTH domain